MLGDPPEVLATVHYDVAALLRSFACTRPECANGMRHTIA